MAKAASSALAKVKADPVRAGMAVASLGTSEAINAGLEATGNKPMSKMLSDPFGSKAAAKEQEDRYNEALKAIENKKLESSSTTDSSSNTTSSSVTDQSSTSTNNQTTKTTFNEAGATEQALTGGQLDAIQAQRDLVASQEQGILARQGVQDSARDTLTGVMGGDAFELSAGEQERINRMRDAGIDVSRNQIDDFLTERLAEVEADAARRGLRGQAFTQLQGDAIGTAAKELNNATLAANQTAAQQAIDMPGARVGIQANAASGMAGFADQLQQQAIQNQSLLADPVLKQQLMEERLAGAIQTTTGTNTTTGKTSTTGTSNTTGTSTTTGQQDIDPTALLAAKANAPGQKASTIAGNIAGIGAVANVAKSVVPLV